MSLLALLVGCSTAPEQQLMWQEHWEVMGILESTRALDASISVGNTGMLRGQGRIHLNLWDPLTSPIQYAKHASPQAVARRPAEGQITLGVDGLSQSEQQWSFRVADDNINTLIQLRSEQTAPVASWTTSGWEIQVLAPNGGITGWLTAGERGGLINGTGVVMRRHGTSPPTVRQSVYIFSPRLTLIADLNENGEGLWWGELDGLPLPTADSTAIFPVSGPIVLSLPGMEVVVDRRRDRGWLNPLEHLLLPEQWLVRPFLGRPIRRMQIAQATAQFGAEELQAPAVVLEVRNAGDFNDGTSPRQFPAP